MNRSRILSLVLPCLFATACSGDLDDWIGEYYRKNVPQATDSLGRANDRLLRKGKMPETDPRTCIVDLADITPFEWDTLYVVDGYDEAPEVDEFIGYKQRKRFPFTLYGFCRKTLFSKDNKIVYAYYQEEYLSDPIISSPQLLHENEGARKYSRDSARFEIHIENHEYHLRQVIPETAIPSRNRPE